MGDRRATESDMCSYMYNFMSMYAKWEIVEYYVHEITIYTSPSINPLSWNWNVTNVIMIVRQQLVRILKEVTVLERKMSSRLFLRVVRSTVSCEHMFGCKNWLLYIYLSLSGNTEEGWHKAIQEIPWSSCRHDGIEVGLRMRKLRFWCQQLKRK